MSMMQRLVRAFETASQYELSDKDRGGMLGEQNAAYIIDDDQNGCYIRNPIIPHPRKPGIYFETDFLVYTHGTLYCIEIKNYRGKVSYAACYKDVLVKKGWFIFKRTVKEQVSSHYDYDVMVQEKMGYNGEGLIKREQPNPLIKTQRYIEDLQNYLYRIEPRLETIPIFPVLGFSDKTDIKDVYNFEAGILSISELPAFFDRYNTPGKHAMAPWVQKALHQLPTWDRILTTGNDLINGTIADHEFNFKSNDGQRQAIPYKNIQEIELHRDGNFSAYDELVITYLDGKKQTFHCVGGEVHLNRFQGEQQIHKLRNVNKILIGVANKR